MIVFVGDRSRTSGYIRGEQVVAAMGDKARFVSSANHAELSSVRDSIVVFIRNFDSGLALQMRSKGCRVGFDLLDRPVADYHAATSRGSLEGDINWKRYDMEGVDFFLVNNALCKQKLDEVVGATKLAYVVPHHVATSHPRMNEQRFSNLQVGYVGLPDQFTLRAEVETVCKQNDAIFVSKHPDTREDVAAMLECIDVGVVYADRGEKIPYTSLYKPNTKLSNYQSYGIPTVASPYKSFKEFGGAGWIEADSKESFLSNLNNLLQLNRNGFEARRELAAAAFAVGSKLTVDQVVENYYLPALKS